MSSYSDKRAIISDYLRERGFGEERIKLLFNVREEDAKSVRVKYISKRREEAAKKRRDAPIPKEIKDPQEKIGWCAMHGGHTIDGFLDYWSCSRCGLSGFD